MRPCAAQPSFPTGRIAGRAISLNVMPQRPRRVGARRENPGLRFDAEQIALYWRIDQRMPGGCIRLCSANPSLNFSPAPLRGRDRAKARPQHGRVRVSIGGSAG